MHVLNNLQANEDEAEQDGQKQAEDEGTAVPFEDPVVCPGAGNATGQKNESVYGRQPQAPMA